MQWVLRMWTITTAAQPPALMSIGQATSPEPKSLGMPLYGWLTLALASRTMMWAGTTMGIGITTPERYLPANITSFSAPPMGALVMEALHLPGPQVVLRHRTRPPQPLAPSQFPPLTPVR